MNLSCTISANCCKIPHWYYLNNGASHFMSRKKKRQARRSTTSQGDTGRSVTAQTSQEGFNPDYTYVIKDLRRIGALAGTFLLVLVILAFFLRWQDQPSYGKKNSSISNRMLQIDFRQHRSLRRKQWQHFKWGYEQLAPAMVISIENFGQLPGAGFLNISSLSY